MNLDLLTNATVVNDAMKFVSEHSSNKTLISNEENSQISKESDYNEEEDSDKQGEETTGEITETTNQVF
jgi:hypothetical protein